jgi:hypothetical protein
MFGYAIEILPIPTPPPVITDAGVKVAEAAVYIVVKFGKTI